MHTTVYVKMDSLLLSEGVCRQLGILTYHGAVRPVRDEKDRLTQATVPIVKVSLVKDVRLLPHQSITVSAVLNGQTGELRSSQSQLTAVQQSEQFV